MRRRRNPYSEAIYPALVAAASGPLRAWLQARAAAVRRVVASLDDRPVLDVSDGIVLRGTERAQNEIIKGAPLRFMWSRNQGFWFIPRSKDRRVDAFTVRRLTEYFAQAGMPVRVVGMVERAEEEGVTLASATGPKLAEVVTRATGAIAAATFDAHDPYFQRYEDPARKALTYLPPGFRVDRRESKYGQIYIFLDSENRLLTRSDYARFGAPEKEAAAIAAERAEVEATQAAEREREAAAKARLLDSARNWRSPDGRRIYEVTSGQYRSIMGIHQPWIGEISPVQYARMSDRAKRAYDEKRHREWSASAEGAAQWQRMVEALALAGEIDTKTPGMFDETRGIVALIGRRRAEQEAEAAKVERERRRALAETQATQAPERMVSATERIDSIRNLVSRGIKRETGALSTSGGMVRYPNDGIASVRVTSRGWTVDPNMFHQRSDRSLSGTFTDADAPEAIAAAIFAALRQLFPRSDSASYLDEAKKSKRVFGAREKTGTESILLTLPTAAGDVEVTLSVLNNGYRVYEGRWYSHSTDAPILEVLDKPPAEALQEAAQRTRRWLVVVEAALADVQRLKAENDALRSEPFITGGPRQAKWEELKAAQAALERVKRAPA
jgi:hypothetical protein